MIPPEGREAVRAVHLVLPVRQRATRRCSPQRHPDVVLADWAAVSNEAGLTYDAMHLTVDGIRLMIDTIRGAGGI